MPFVEANDVKLYYEEHGQGDTTVLYIHGNLGCKDWMDLAWQHLPQDIRVIAIEWRGCGQSEKVPPAADYSNYTMSQHADDMLAAMKQLGIQHCHLCGHSTGGFIALRMLAKAPQMFGKFLALDPVGPLGLALPEEQLAVFGQMKADRAFDFRVMATAAPTLFQMETLNSDAPAYAESTTAEQKALYERIIDNTQLLTDGIWYGTPINLTREWNAGGLRDQISTITHQTRVLWGEFDFWIPRDHMEDMAKSMPNCELLVIPGVGHSCNVEQPALFGKYFADFFDNVKQTGCSSQAQCVQA